MCFQGFSKEKGVHVKLARVQGSELIGTRVKAPLSTYGEVYVLPMENVLPTKVSNQQLISFNNNNKPLINHYNNRVPVWLHLSQVIHPMIS
jgi:hypothetical protein